MIVTLSKNLIKSLQAGFGENFSPLSVNEIVQQAGLDPQVTNIDVIVFTLKDACGGMGGAAKSINQALQSAHDQVILVGLDDGKISAKQRSKLPERENMIIVPYGKGDDLVAVVDGAYQTGYNKLGGSVPEMSSNDDISSDIQTMGEMDYNVNLTPEEQQALLGDQNDGNMGDAEFDFNPEVEEQQFPPIEPMPTPEPVPAPEPVAPASPSNNEMDDILKAIANNTQADINRSETNNAPNAADIHSGVPEDFFNVPPEAERNVHIEEPFVQPIEQQIVHTENVRSLNELARDLDKNKIYAELLRNSAAFQDVTEKLRIVDKQILDIRNNSDLTASQRINEIKRVCDEKASLKGVSNALVVDYVCSIIDNITNAATVLIDNEISKLKSRVASLSERELYKGNKETVSKLCDERYKIQLQLTELLASINSICSIMVDVTNDTTDTFIEGIPTSNPFINQFLTPVTPRAPLNLMMHVNKLFEAIQEKTITFSAIEAQVRALLQTTAKLVEISDDIIAVQQDLINQMEVQKIEDVVIVSSLLKNVLRVYVGGINSGKSASTAVIHELHSRKGESLLVDLTTNNSLKAYFTDMYKLEDVMQSSSLSAYNVLYSEDASKVKIKDLIQFLTDCTQQYRYIDIITDIPDILHDIQNETLTTTIFMQPTITSINQAKAFVDVITTVNMAKQICVINPAVEPSEMFDILSISPNEFKYTCIPNIPEIQKCALRGVNPGEIREIRTVFEEEFK